MNHEVLFLVPGMASAACKSPQDPTTPACHSENPNRIGHDFSGKTFNFDGPHLIVEQKQMPVLALVGSEVQDLADFLTAVESL